MQDSFDWISGFAFGKRLLGGVGGIALHFCSDLFGVHEAVMKHLML
jgi:hypothetical protein